MDHVTVPTQLLPDSFTDAMHFVVVPSCILAGHVTPTLLTVHEDGGGPLLTVDVTVTEVVDDLPELSVETALITVVPAELGEV